VDDLKQRYRQILDLKEISERTKMPPDSLRWKRHRGELPWIFRLGRRLVAFEDECDAWIEEQRRLTSRR
jgi:predicted DNA-binding transcriptional regulator AlpA